MPRTKTSRYDIAEHLRTPKEMAAYLEACLEEADGDAAFIAKAPKLVWVQAMSAGVDRVMSNKALSENDTIVPRSQAAELSREAGRLPLISGRQKVDGPRCGARFTPDGRARRDMRPHSAAAPAVH